MEFEERRHVSTAWEFFTKKDETLKLATCKICQKDYSYKTTITNLKKHVKQKHGIIISAETEFKHNSDSDSHEEFSTPIKSKANSTLKYYDNIDKHTATCKICDIEVNYNTVEDLTKHVESHDAKLTDDELSEELDLDESKLSSPSNNTVWKYFERVDSQNKLAICLICRKKLSYKSSKHNLKQHLFRKHSKLCLKDEEKKIVISSHGQLYEIATSPKSIKEDDNDDPIEMDAVYLNDDNETYTQHIPTRETQKHKKHTYQRRRFSKPVPVDSSTDDEEIVRKKTMKDNKINSIDYFGNYIVSLLKEMPKNVADQLQSDIIKQVISAKLACEKTEPNIMITVNPVMNNSDINNMIAVTKLDNGENDNTNNVQ